MVVRRRKKSQKYRGSRFMRRGYNDRHRGKGSKGGRGNSGWKFKKHKYLKLLREKPELFEDKKGFIPPTQREIKSVTLDYISSKIYDWLEEGIVKKIEDKIEIDLVQMGFDKLLGNGEINMPVIIKVPMASEKAIEKVEAVGGKVILSS